MGQGLIAELTGDLVTALGGSGEEAGLERSLVELKQRLIHRSAQHPIDTMVDVTLAGTVLFYLLERDHNPKVRTLADAFWAVTSCIAAVSDAGGAVTSRGKVLLGVIMGIGPGLQALVAAEGVTHRVTPPPAPALDPVVVSRLEHIATLLEQLIEKHS